MNKLLYFPRQQNYRRDWRDMPEYAELAAHEPRPSRKPAPNLLAPLMALGMAAAMLPWLPLAYFIHLNRPK